MVEEFCVSEQNKAESGTNLLYCSAMPQIKRAVSDPLYNWPNKKGKGGKFNCSACDENYAYRQSLANHMSKAHGVKQDIMEDNSFNGTLNISGQYKTNFSETSWMK